jgi:hypothetical protein
VKAVRNGDVVFVNVSTREDACVRVLGIRPDCVKQKERDHSCEVVVEVLVGVVPRFVVLKPRTVVCVRACTEDDDYDTAKKSTTHQNYCVRLALLSNYNYYFHTNTTLITTCLNLLTDIINHTTNTHFHITTRAEYKQ